MKKFSKVFTIFIVLVAATATVLACITQSAWAETLLGPANEGATYNVTFDANGGTVKLTEYSSSGATIMVNTSVVEAAPIATKSGKIFSGWYTNSQGSGTKIIFPYIPTGAVTLYASYIDDAGSTVLISSAQDLFDIRYSLKKSYMLTKDINLEGEVWRPIGYMDIVDADGKQSRYDMPFEGSLDGNGHKIYNFKLELDENSEGLDANFLCKGLFSVLDSAASIRNLTVSDFTVNINGSVSRFYIGGIVGKVLNGTISNCKVKGDFINPKSDYEEGIWDDFFGSYDQPTSNTYIGGIAGLVGASGHSDNEDENTETTEAVSYITNCSFEGSILSESVASNVYLGGLIGYNRTANVNGCYTYADIKGRYAGGLMGYNDSVVNDCYSVGTVTGSLAYPAIGGGLLAYNDSNGTVSACYFVGSVTARTAGGLIGVNLFSFLTASNGISNCYANAQVTASEYGGGLLGRTEAVIPINGIVDYAQGIFIRENGLFTNLYYIHHCLSFGEVNVSVKDVYYVDDDANPVGTDGVYHSVFAGGLIGHASEPFIASCIAFGDVLAKSERPISGNDEYVYNAVYANNLIGHSTSKYISGTDLNAQKSAYRNVFGIEEQAVIRNIEENYSDFNTVPSLSYLNANSLTYLSNPDGLAFDTSIWNLSSLDIQNGVLPTLR
ncbi:MAG: InlB B-repeat-containing protein [Clostridia bacterium]|nr:InlB B-repeat-containing protein [Clostridia bacterium]